MSHKTSHYAYGHGGHVGGHLREPFCEYAETGELPEGTRHRGRELDIRALTGLLWNCTDTMPSGTCTALDLPAGSSYAAGARAVRPKAPVMSGRGARYADDFEDITQAEIDALTREELLLIATDWGNRKLVRCTLGPFYCQMEHVPSRIVAVDAAALTPLAEAASPGRAAGASRDTALARHGQEHLNT
jgi:hypothetical protein